MRLFLAIDPGEACRNKLAAYIEKARTHTSGIRWVKPEKLHITMAFLGEVHDSRLEQVVSSSQRLTVSHRPFTASVHGSGVFPNWRRPRVVWLGIEDRGALGKLGADIQAMCLDLGYPTDHPFRAHLTIGRAGQPLSAPQRQGLKKALEVPIGPHPFDVTRVSLLSSKLGAGGSVYSELASFPLGGA